MAVGRAPWWALLFSGLSLGSAAALLVRLMAWWKNYSRHLALRSRALAGAAAAQKALPDAKLGELVASLSAHAQETREATASLRRSVEQQQRLYQVAAVDFHRKLDEAWKRKPTVSRMEVAPESMQMLRSLVSCQSRRDSSENGAKALSADAALQQLLRGAPGAPGTPRGKRSLQTLSMILQNLMDNPGQEKFQEVNALSARFRETFEGTSGAAGQLLRLAGFEQQGDSFRWPDGRAVSEARQIQEMLQEALRKSSEANSAPAASAAPAAPWASATVQEQLSRVGS
ncbi:unnamed protein product [Effrenium voratum]|nr:unnamed protein product [Effrenium voratum]